MALGAVHDATDRLGLRGDLPSPPDVTLWRTLETNDAVGWNA
jgi:hypothetical protein